MNTLSSSMVLANSLFAAGLSMLDSPAMKAVAWIIGLLAVLGLAWGASAAIDFLARWRSRNKADQALTGGVFDDLCAAQELPDDIKRLLLDGAAELQLDCPAILFVDSGLLKKLAASDRDDASDFRDLVERLFPSAGKPAEVEESEAVATV